MRMLADVFQESRFACTCLTREKDRLAGLHDEVKRILKFRIIGVDRGCHDLGLLTADK